MGFFSDMNESDFEEQGEEIKPIVMDPNASAEDIDYEDEDSSSSEPTVSRAELGGDDDEDDEEFAISTNIDFDEEEDDNDFGEPLVEPVAPAPAKKQKETPAPKAKQAPAPVEEETQKPDPVKASKTDATKTVIAKGTTITGGIHSEDDILIEGTVEGSVEAKSVLIQNGGVIREGVIAKENLEIHGNIDGDISGRDIRLYQSKVHGNLTAEGSVYVDKSSVLNSDIQGKDIEVYGRIKGEISVTGKATLHRGCIVKGTVRCKDILLETGAKFQGAVEQVSSEDIDDSLFE